MSKPLHSRILLKLSGEVLTGKQEYGIDPIKASKLANEIKCAHDMGTTIILVIGAGNIFRGIQAASKGMDRVTGDYLGMLATIMNAISIQDALEKLNVQTRTLSAITVSQISEPYIRRRALRHLEKNRVVIVAGGTGNPYFSTDTAAALRATELKAEILLKATKEYKQISYSEILSKNLRIMDMTAITLCKENNLPIRVFDVNGEGNLNSILNGKDIGTFIS